MSLINFAIIQDEGFLQTFWQAWRQITWRRTILSLHRSQVELNLEWFLIIVHASDCLENLLCESKNSSIREPAERHENICDSRYELPMGDIAKLIHLPTASRIISANCMIVYSPGFPWKKINQLKKQNKTKQNKRNSCFLRQILSVVESQALCTELVLGDVQLSIAYWHDRHLNRPTLSLFPEEDTNL